jgi:hypothetical protein
MTDKLAVSLTIIVIIGTFLLVAASWPPVMGKADSLIPKNRPLTYQGQCSAA